MKTKPSSNNKTIQKNKETRGGNDDEGARNGGGVPAMERYLDLVRTGPSFQNLSLVERISKSVGPFLQSKNQISSLNKKQGFLFRPLKPFVL